MEIMEIILLTAGAIIFILSFFIPERKTEISVQSKDLARDEIAALIGKEMESIRGHVDDVVDEAVTYAMEKTERSLERLSNEKIMAVNEYSDTVLSEIHKNHEEAMFLYDMLNSKHANLKDTVSVINKTVKEAEEAVTGLQRLAPEAMTGLQRLAPETVNSSPSPVPKASENSRETGQEKVKRTRAAATAATMAAEPAASAGSASAAVRGKQETAPGRVSFLPETDSDGQNNNQKILELYHQGRSKVAIARELGLGVGEVKLVIDLFKNQ